MAKKKISGKAAKKAVKAGKASRRALPAPVKKAILGSMADPEGMPRLDRLPEAWELAIVVAAQAHQGSAEITNDEINKAQMLWAKCYLAVERLKERQHRDRHLRELLQIGDEGTISLETFLQKLFPQSKKATRLEWFEEGLNDIPKSVGKWLVELTILSQEEFERDGFDEMAVEFAKGQLDRLDQTGVSLTDAGVWAPLLLLWHKEFASPAVRGSKGGTARARKTKGE